jgi:cell division septum initiation protein DivIVA
MKKAFKITGIVVGSLLLLLIILPFAFKGKIVERVRTEINKNLNANVEFGAFRLSFIRSFPDVLVRIDELKIIGVGPFEKDTLAAIGRTGVTIDLFSLFRESGFEVKSVRLEQPNILLKVLKDGTANWDIMKETEDDEIAEGDAFVLHLKQARISRGNLIYHDDEIATYVLAEDVNATLRGDLSLEVTTISTRNASIGAFSLRYEKMPILSKIAVNLTAEIEANLVDYIYTFRENEAFFNELPVRFDGLIGLPEEGILMDFTFAALRSDFKDFLSIIPAVYTKDFSALKADGTLELNGFVKGTYTEDEIPGFGIKLGIKDGMFQYPNLPASVSHVQLSLNIDNPGKDFDLTVVDMPALKMNLGGNPIDAKLNLRTPVSDPQIDALLNGSIDLSQVKNFYPLEAGTSLRGFIDSDLQARGRMSAIKSGRYNDFFAEGHLKVNNLFYSASDLPQTVEVSLAEFFLSPQFVSMPAFAMKLGESDLNASGRIDNILGFVLDKQLLTGSFETRSSFFNLNQLMEETPEETADEPMQLSVIKVPENIDFSLRSRFDRLLFGKLDITNVEGQIRVAESRAVLQNIRMNLLGGSLSLNGAYSTHGELAEIDFGLDISQFDIQQAFQAFNTFQVLAPIGQYALGNFSANLSLSSLLDKTLSPLLESLTGFGNLSSPSLSLQGSPAMTKLSDLTRVDAFRQFNIRDLLVAFEFADGKVDVKPFDLRFGQSLAKMSGSTFFDQTISFLMNIEMPRAQFGGAANQVLDNLVTQAAGKGLNITPGETVNLDVIIKGTFTNPEVSFGLSGVMDDAVDQLRDQLEQRLQDEVDQVRDRVEDQVREGVDEARQKVQAELDARAAQVMEQANRQADNIRREANAGAERIRTEARQQALRLENEASGVIAKAAAKRAGEALIREADQRAKQVEDEGERNAQRIISEAQLQADRIRSGEEE